MKKTALITGAARGIGAAIALRLANDGFDVALNDLNENSFAGSDILEKCAAAGAKALAFYADVSDYAQCETMIKAVKEQFGSIDVLVNNAGITRDGLAVRMPEDQYDLVIAINQKSVFNMCKFASSVMIKQKSGRIINMASVAGLYGNAGQINYSASKAAVIAMTKTLSKELGSRNITVNAVAPGFIETPMTDKLSDDQKNKILELISMKRYGNVGEVAGTVSFLASDDASYITGQTIEISGGLSM